MCADQAEQTKYEARIVGLQRAKHEAVAKAEAQSQKAILLQQEFDKHVAEKARYAQNVSCFIQKTTEKPCMPVCSVLLCRGYLGQFMTFP